MVTRRLPFHLALALVLSLVVAACGSDIGDGTPDGAADAGALDVPADVALPDDGGADVAVPTDTQTGDAAADAAVDAGGGPDTEAADVAPDGAADVPTDVEPPLPPLPTQAPLAVPADPLAGTAVESCAVFREERCEGGQQQRCAVYDTGAAAFVAEGDLDPLFRRVLLFDRWRDLYNSPDGQAVDRSFSVAVPPGTPESEWGQPENFSGYWGTGDGGIWTGWSVVAAVLRYAQTGTQADYERMEQHVRDMVTMYDVTGIPGYLCRYHYLELPAGGPNSPDHVLRWEGSYTPTHHNRTIPNPETIPNLPALYTEGLADAGGTVWHGTPKWHGRPSIDQNSGPMTSLPMAWGLLRDEALKDRISHHLTCYLKRLQRIELINLQQNPELMEGLVAYFSAGELQLDPDDIDLMQLDTIVAYVHRQVNTANEATIDMSCPDTVQLEPWRVIDAASVRFGADLLDLINDMDTNLGRPGQIDHYYFPSIRGADAMHLMHLATMAYYFTGDEQYRTFLYKTLVDEIDAIGVLHTAGAFDLPKYCKKYYSDQITYGPWWAFLHLIGDGELKTHLQRAFHNEMWEKLVKQNGNVDMAIMYAGAVPPDVATDHDEALAYALENLPWMGGNGGLSQGAPFDPVWLDEPRRSYNITAAEVVAALPEGNEDVCLTEEEHSFCSAEVTILGMTMPNLSGWSTYACSGAPNECPLGEDQCTSKMAALPLPIPLRPFTDFLWQRNPFALGKGAGLEGGTQYAGSDLSEPFWNARRYGFLTAGEGQVLAWESVGDCGE